MADSMSSVFASLVTTFADEDLYQTLGEPSVNRKDLEALNLVVPTYMEEPGTRTPSCTTPRQPTINLVDSALRFLLYSALFFL